jgi:hypothetical protein
MNVSRESRVKKKSRKTSSLDGIILWKANHLKKLVFVFWCFAVFEWKMTRKKITCPVCKKKKKKKEIHLTEIGEVNLNTIFWKAHACTIIFFFWSTCYYLFSSVSINHVLILINLLLLLQASGVIVRVYFEGKNNGGLKFPDCHFGFSCGQSTPLRSKTVRWNFC